MSARYGQHGLFRLNGKAWLLNCGNALQAAAPGPLTDIAWTQPYPIHPESDDYFRVGWCDPIGGIGPYTWSLVNTTSGGGSYSFTAGELATIRVFGVPPGTATDVLQITCTDGRGVTVAKNVTVEKSEAASVIAMNSRNPIHNCTSNTFNQPLFTVRAAGGTHANTDNVTISGPASSEWTMQYGLLRWATSTSDLPPGDYPLMATLTDSNNQNPLELNFTIHIQPFAPITWIEFVPATVSTSMLPSSVVGRALATTPNNAPSWSLTDPTGTFQIDSNTGTVSVANQPATAGPVPFSITVTDQIATYTQSFVLSVVQGTTLPAANMTMTVNPALNNATLNQTIGTPSVTGVTGSQRWSLVSQTGFNPVAKAISLNNGGSYVERYQIDPSTGTITAAPLLSYQTDTLVVSCTDGINTCTQTFSVPVAEAPSTQYYIGRGMSTAYPGIGFETLAEARGLCINYHPDTKVFNVYADADPNYYKDDNGLATQNYGLRFPWIGPVKIVGMAANGVAQPRFGGDVANNVAGDGGDMRGKGFIVFGDGDGWMTNCEVSCVHGSDPTHGLEGIRKDGESYGNLTITGCVVHDCDNGIESGVNHGTITVEYCEIGNGGTNHVSSGACHNLYIGNAGKLIFRYNVTRRATLGHLLKCRAMVSEIHDNRFFDGLGGSASCNIDLPNGGQATIQNNVFVKGAMAMNPYCIQYGAEGVSASLNTLVVQNNTIAVETLAGSHYGTPSAVAYYHLINANGQGSSAQITNNALWLSPQSTSYTTFNSAPAGAVTETGTTSLTLPPTLDMTRPYLSGTLPILGTLYRHTLYGQDDFQNFEGVLQLQDREQIVVPHTATPGAVLCTVTAHSDLVSGAEQFGSGTTWAIVTDPVYYSVLNPNPWAPAGRYAVGTNADGTGTLSVAGTLASGVDWVQLRATAPNGTTLCDSRYPILVA